MHVGELSQSRNRRRDPRPPGWRPPTAVSIIDYTSLLMAVLDTILMMKMLSWARTWTISPRAKPSIELQNRYPEILNSPGRSPDQTMTLLRAKQKEMSQVWYAASIQSFRECVTSFKLDMPMQYHFLLLHVQLDFVDIICRTND
jgi:hypothetical protein